MVNRSVPSPDDFTLESSPVESSPMGVAGTPGTPVPVDPSRPAIRATAAFLQEMLARFRERPESTLDMMAPFGGIAARDEDDRTLLHWAMKSAADDVKRFRALLAAGADLDAIDHRGESPLSLAFAASGLTPAATLVPLLHAGALPCFSRLATHTRAGRSPLHETMLGSEHQNWGTVLDALIARGALLDARDEHGNTALHLAVRHQREGFLPHLFIAGASVDALNTAGITPLLSALWADRSVEDKRKASAFDRGARDRLVTLLLNAGANPDQTLSPLMPTDGPVMSALAMVAAERPVAWPLFQRLVEAGADPDRPALSAPGSPPRSALEMIQNGIDALPPAEQPAVRVPLEALVLKRAMAAAQASEPGAAPAPTLRAPVRARL